MLSFRLAVLSLKKKRESCLLLALFVMFAVLFLDMGMSVSRKTTSLFHEKIDELNEAHFLAPSRLQTHRAEYEEYIKGTENISCYEREEVVYMPTSTNNCNDLELGAIIYNKDVKREIGPLVLTEEDTSIPAQKAIYVPVQLKSENVLLGENYELTYKGKTYSFQVAGYFETTAYANVNCGLYKYFVSETTYRQMAGEVGKAYMLSVRFEGTPKQVEQRSADLKTAFLRDTTYAMDKGLTDNAISYKNLQERTITNLEIGCAIFLAMAFLICMVVLFIIMNYIREEINKATENIGILQSMGYRLREIRNSYILEYLLIAVAGGVVGIAASYLCIMCLAPYFTGMCGFSWKGFAHPAEDIKAFVLAMGLVTLSCFMAVRKMRRLTPVVALNGENERNQKKRNFFPLQWGALPLNLHMAVKNLGIYAKSSLIYSVIVWIGSLAMGTILIIFLNFSVNTEALLSIIGFELADLQVEVSTGCDVQNFGKELEACEQVRKINFSSTGNLVKFIKETFYTHVIQDYSKLEWVIPYEGSCPETENEVMISALLAQEAGKTVGDTIPLSANGVEKNYMVSGIYSSTNGEGAYFTLSGIRLLYPDFRLDYVDVYLNEDVNVEDFRNYLNETYKVSVDYESNSVAEQKIARLLADYGVSSVSYSIWKDGVEICSGDSSAFSISDITDLKSFAKAQLESYSKNLSTIVAIIFFIMIVIIGCVLQITTKSEVNRSRKEYGVLKALGYTTRDIIRQVSLRFLIATVLGCLTGSMIAYVCAPAWFLGVFGMMGVTRIAIKGYFGVLATYSILLSVILYVVTLLTCRRIKSITAYELLTE